MNKGAALWIAPSLQFDIELVRSVPSMEDFDPNDLLID
jgi:hypothetical protein